MYTEALSPAQLVKRRLEEAQRLADEQAWKQYEEEQERHKKHRFKIKEFDNWTHAKPGTYSAGCRCEECTASWREYMREYNRKYREAHPKPKREPKGRAGRTVKEHMHGTLTGYSYGCRCEQCTAAHREARPKASVKNHGSNYAYRHQKCRCRKCVKAERERRRKPDARKMPEHGTRARYDRKCRCAKCVEGFRQYWRDRRAKVKTMKEEQEQQNKKFKPIPPPKETHDIVRTVSAYELQDRDDAE